MTPMKMRRFRLFRFDLVDREWLGEMLNRECAPFDQGIKSLPDGDLLTPIMPPGEAGLSEGLTSLSGFRSFFSMKAHFQTGIPGHPPVPPEKRHLTVFFKWRAVWQN
jgi:hypothetical protein